MVYLQFTPRVGKIESRRQTGFNPLCAFNRFLEVVLRCCLSLIKYGTNRWSYYFFLILLSISKSLVHLVFESKVSRIASVQLVADMQLLFLCLLPRVKMTCGTASQVLCDLAAHFLSSLGITHVGWQLQFVHHNVIERVKFSFLGSPWSADDFQRHMVVSLP